MSGAREPAIGDAVVVIYAEADREINGTRMHPAIVSRVWTRHSVNVRVMTDGAGIEWLPWVPHRSIALPGGLRWCWPVELA